MDPRVLDDLQRRLEDRSWLYDDPKSHAAGVEDAVAAVRALYADRKVPADASVTRRAAPRHTRAG
jgi:hypothetical protein